MNYTKKKNEPVFVAYGTTEQKPDELCHYGVKGMKWGIRRYQNKDGSLTPKGRKHIEENAGHYLNPAKKTKNTKNRKKEIL